MTELLGVVEGRLAQSPLMRPSQSSHRPLTPDLSNPATVAELSTEAIRLVDQIGHEWGLTVEQRATLLGGVSVSTYQRRVRQPENTHLNIDELTRASYIVGIYRALETLYSDPLPSLWMSIPNRNPLFQGSTPLDHAFRYGIPGLANIRVLLDGFRGGI